MTHTEFSRLLSFFRAKHYRPTFNGTSRRAAKRMGAKQQGRALVPLEKLFINTHK